MIKRLVIIAIASAITLWMALAGLYLSWPYWSEPLARQLLSHYSVVLNSADISRPTASTIRITRLDLDYTSAAYRVSLQAQTLSIHYSLRQLFNGRLQEVEIPQLKLQFTQVQPAGEIPSATISPTPLALLLPQHLFTAAPIEKFDIADITWASTQLRPLSYLRGGVHFDGEQLALNLYSPDARSTAFSMRAAKDNTLLAQLTLNGAEVARINSRAEVSTKGGHSTAGLTGTVLADLGQITGLFEQFGVWPEGYSLSGDFSASWSLPLPSVVDANSLHELRPSGTISSSGTYRIPQSGPGRHSSVEGAYRIRGSYRVIDQQLEWLNQDMSISAQPYLPLVYTQQNPELQLKPLNLQLDLPAGVVVKARMDGTLVHTENLSALLLLSHQPTQLDTRLSLQRGKIEVNPGDHKSIRGRAIASLNTAIGSLKVADISAEQLNLTTTAEFTVDSGRYDLNTLATTSLTAGRIYQDHLSLPDVRFDATKTISLHWQDGRLTSPAAELVMDKQRLQIAEHQWNLDRAQINLSQLNFDTLANRQPDVNLKLNIRNLELISNELKLAPIQFDANLKLLGGQVNGKFSASAGDQLVTSQGTLSHNLHTGVGGARANSLSTTFSEQRSFLPRLLKPAPLPVDFSAGQILANTTLQWNQQGITDTSTELTMLDLGGFYQRNLFKKLNTTVKIVNFHGQMQINAHALHIGQIDAGVSISNVQFDIEVMPPEIRLSNLQAELFGGVARQKTLLYDWSQPENLMVINLQDVELKQLLNLQAGISGTGSLDGSLPIVFSKAGIRIAKGDVFNQPPGGVIRYKANAPLANTIKDDGLKLTLEALKNFHYDVLKMNLDSDEQGNLVIAASLQGRNPDLQQRRPIHFNLNITESLPALLQSLKLKQNVSDDLERRIESLFNPGKQELLQ